MVPQRLAADTLNGAMDFDHVIRVHDDGTVSDVTDVYAPEAYAYTDDGGAWRCELDRDGWELLSGYSGQYGYAGPWMHASEYIGGAMARDILATPGVYVAIYPSEADGSDPDTWAVARLKA